MARKKKYEKIECSNEHIFYLDYDGEIRQWKCVVLEDEVITYEGDEERKHLKIMNKVREPHVIQIDVHTTIYGEQIPFQLENGIPFIKLQGEWVASETFQEAKQAAQIKMYKKYSKQEVIAGIVTFVIMFIVWAVTGTMDDAWILSVFGIFFFSSAGMRMVRLRNELNALKEAEEAAAAEEALAAQNDGVDAVAAARAALESGEAE